MNTEYPSYEIELSVPLAEQTEKFPVELTQPTGLEILSLFATTSEEVTAKLESIQTEDDVEGLVHTEGFDEFAYSSIALVSDVPRDVIEELPLEPLIGLLGASLHAMNGDDPNDAKIDAVQNSIRNMAISFEVDEESDFNREDWR